MAEEPSKNETPVADEPQEATYVRPPTITSGEPETVTCPHCKNSVVTTVRKKGGACMWLAVTITALFTCGACAWLPCCIDTCKDSNHFCPSCQAIIASVKKL